MAGEVVVVVVLVDDEPDEEELLDEDGTACVGVADTACATIWLAVLDKAADTPLQAERTSMDTIKMLVIPTICLFMASS